MSTIVESPRIAPARRMPKPKSKPKPKSTPTSTPTSTPWARRRLVAGGVLWIVALGALLAGVVAVNVLVLQLNMRLDELGHTRAELKADNARLRSQISTAAANIRIEGEARERLGLVPVDLSATTYVPLKP